MVVVANHTCGPINHIAPFILSSSTLFFLLGHGLSIDIIQGHDKKSATRASVGVFTAGAIVFMHQVKKPVNREYIGTRHGAVVCVRVNFRMTSELKKWLLSYLENEHSNRLE